ncbi:MAG: hypothetical protein GX633_01265, partial [Clostridiales bacterium]|nr:hypothetical protein [Clostridiales bacterium]
MDRNTGWKQPFTNKRYLHPPFAENMFTMWPDLKVICGDIIEQGRLYISSGFRILTGDELESPDFKNVEYVTRPDGIPVHVLYQNMGDYTIKMESFCSIERVPTSYTEFTVRNNREETIQVKLGFLPRTGREDHLVGLEVDGYASYNSNVHNWGFLPTSWRQSGYLLTDDEYSILFDGFKGFDTRWQGDEKGLVWYKRRLLILEGSFKAGESKTFRCAFCHGEILPFDYEDEKKKTISFWQKELTRLTKVPGGDEYAPLVKNLVCQCLQMFAYPIGKDYVLPRQGGLQRLIWPVEGIEFLMALDRLGDFRDYTDTAYETYFFTLQCSEGEDDGAVQNLSGQRWGSITGGSCWGCARHALYLDSKEAFSKYKEHMYRAFKWMERKRSETKDNESGRGLFPAMKSCDWPGEYQSWCLTDAVSLMGYCAMAEAFRYFGDERAKEIEDSYNDYMASMKAALRGEAEKNTFEDEILLTNKVGVKMTDPPTGAYFVDGPSSLIRAGVIEPCGEIAKLVENYYHNRGMMKNGLTGLMNDGLIFQGHNADPWAGHTWYVGYGDMNWFYNWLWGGEREKAKETLFAQFKYGMSKEFYLL